MLTFTVLAAVEKNVKSCPWHGNGSPGCQQNMFFQLFVHECLNVVAETRLFRQLFFRRSSKHMSWSMRRQLVMLVCSTVTVSDRFSSGWSLRVMAHGWDNLLKEVEGLHEFIEAQKAVCEKSQIQAMLESHASQISRRTLQCSAEGAKAFTALVSKGPWSDAQKASLGSWCGEQLLNSVQAPVPKREGRLRPWHPSHITSVRKTARLWGTRRPHFPPSWNAFGQHLGFHSFSEGALDHVSCQVLSFGVRLIEGSSHDDHACNADRVFASP